MKFKGKKAIMAAALSAIVAASSFGTAITASAEQTYSISEITALLSGSWDGVSTYLVDSNGNQFSRSDAVPGNSYTVIFNVPSNCSPLLKVWIKGDESTAIYPNSTGTIRYTFTMPARNITIQAILGELGSLTTPEPTPTPTPTPAPTPTPTPDPTPTWKKGDADCNRTVNTADATAVLKHIVGITMLSDQGFKNADMDDNGQITSADATAILKLIISKV